MGNRTAADQNERERVLDPGASFIVQAPAGSGKTGLLIQRYLGLLARVEWPEETVAMTFTNKAAAEMRGRVMGALIAARTGAEPDGLHARTTWRLAREVLARDAHGGWRLEENPGRLRIQTVDSFCALLTRQMPMLSRLGAQPETVDDPEPLYHEAAARTLAQLDAGESWSEAIAALLAYFDNDLPRARNLLATMLRRRDQWLRHVARGVRRDELEGALARLVNASLAGLRGEFPEALVDELLALAEFAARNLENGDQPVAIRACAGLAALPDADHAAVPQWLGIAELLLTRDGGWRKAVNVNQGFPPGEKRNKERFAAMKGRMKSLLAQVAGHDRLLRRLVELRYLPPVRYEEREWEIAQALSASLLLAEAQLRIVFSERHQIDFIGVAMAANQALEQDGAPTDLALHLDHRIRHLLVDEFQDISINQYGLLERLTAGWQQGDGRTLFLVGDPMQSIYGFREAEVGKFLETWQRRRLGQIALEPLRIRVNFRSRAGIVNWVNDVFRHVLPERPDVARGAVDFAPAEAIHGGADDAAVTLHAQRGRDDSAESESVLNIIRAERARDPAGTIAILVRNRNYLHAIVPALQQAGMRYCAVEIDPLGERPAIQDLLALTRALSHLADRIAWLAVLRAPWCGLTLAELLSLVEDGAPGAVWQCLNQADRLARLSPDSGNRALRVRDEFAAAFARQGRVPVHRNVAALWLSVGGPATLQSAADLDNARAFLDLLRAHESGGRLRDLAAFTEAVQKLFGAPDLEADGTLQIMTMHKAKGLEFDTVILPGLGRGRRRDDRELMLWDERAREDGGQDLLLAPIRAIGAEEVPLYKCLQYFENERQDYEEGRLLYVAATRARCRLHLLGSARADNDGALLDPRRDSPLSQLWPVVRGEFESARAPAAAQRSPDAAAERRTLRRLAPEWSLPDAPDAVPWQSPFAAGTSPGQPEFEWAGETAMHVGTVYHRAIQRIAEQGLSQWDVPRVRDHGPVFVALLRQLGVAEAELDAARALVEQALINTLEDDRGRWILSPDHFEAHNEFTVSGLHRGRPVNAVIDRTFLDREGTRWIIDYKTGRHEGADRDAFLARELERYSEPLSRYRSLLTGVFPQPVRTALYFPLLRGWISA
ncbi:MAG: UvrD-helicase domain-containing protein [Gammaproteobacteria bacterium]|nr:UvrD-helicase domain-containing protein [Gammaproteobacteria bacterium]